MRRKLSETAFPRPDRRVRIADLNAAFARADRLVIKVGGSSDRVLFESDAAGDISSLRESLVLLPSKRAFDCMCSGGPAIELFASGRQLVELRYLHDEAIRCSLWRRPVPLGDVQKLVSWFEARLINHPIFRFRVVPPGKPAPPSPAWLEWSARTPEPLVPLLTSGDPRGRRTQIALKRALPDEDVRIRTLLEWFGSGAGPWSGFPGWELTPQQLLSAYPCATIVRAMRTAPLTEQMTEGAARLFASWSYQAQFARHVAALPADVKALLWEHASRSDDRDKRQRAACAFGMAL